ncbi:amidohydrolase 3 [Pseudomassariella vexata]|uniref:Amidohydrolase 3 n=1 Tax=Pseudomassariella vexata TaxID=1141098 RepID=A0A1Y2EJK7_9PEZI|nr:amidohydrolase 3 [Pseudomassariella vexata]ORY70995.1 amidohydrolase 3 [Pseudomassariella vexata]
MIEYQAGDIIFIGATIIDGTGTQNRYKADVLVRDGLIQSIGTELEKPSQDGVRIVDCDNGRWVLSPGFIDMHAHSDLSLLHTPDHLAKITQGVTTEVIGQDGISYSPVNDETMARIRKQIAGWNGNPTDPPDFFDRWRSVEEYLDVLDASKIATNVAYLVPQGNLRMLVKGWDSSPATQAEIDAMKEILHMAFKQGAVGMSSGLTYVPGNFADFEELSQLCEIVKQYGGYYCPHTRSYGKGAMEAYAEMIELAKKTGVRLHLTHATLNFAENVGRADEFLEMVDKAISEGIQLSMDTYPYLPGSTTLAATLPSWVASADDKLAILSDPAQLEKIRHQALVQGTDGCHGCTLNWEIIEISGVQRPSLAEKYVGKMLGQIARELNQDPFLTFIQILKEDDFGTTIMQHAGHEGNVRKIMRHRTHTGGSDGILTSTKPHPRGWGTFPRYLGHYHRDLAQGKSRRIEGPQVSEGTGPVEFDDVEPETIFVGGLEEAVSHLTGRAAGVIGLRDRGLIKEGYRADLLLFDADAIRDAATFANPRQPATGIRAVLVNGQFAVDDGKPTGARAGRTIQLKRGNGNDFVVA